MFVPHMKHLRTTEACYGYNFTLLYVMMFVSHRKHMPSLPVTEIALLSYM
jgi:hypothetical protein